MGTSSVVIFKKHDGSEDNRFYKHYDGYPSAMGRWLKQFFTGMDATAEGYSSETWLQRFTEVFQERPNVFVILYKVEDFYFEKDECLRANFFYELSFNTKEEQFYLKITHSLKNKVIYDGRLNKFVPSND